MSRSLGDDDTLLMPSNASPPLIAPSPMTATTWRSKGLIRLNNAFKSVLSHQQNIFEGMNIRYFGPFDGHDIKEVVRLLRQLKDMKGPKLLHLHTTKGKGYKPAEDEATIWHAPGRFYAGPDRAPRAARAERGRE